MNYICIKNRFTLPLIILNIHLVQFTPLVNMPYVGSELSRVQKFHSEQIQGSDSINLLLLMLDSSYRHKVWNQVCLNLAFNNRLKPALQEISVKYGYKLEELTSLVWEQSTLFDEAV